MEEEESGRREQQKSDLVGRGSGAVCCFLLVFLLVAAVAVAGLVLSILEFVREPGPKVDITDNRPIPDYEPEGDEEETVYVPGSYNPEEIWLMQFFVDDTNLEYLDPIVGQIKGYNMDIVNAVCRKANKNCQIVLDSYSRCWSGGYGAEGLMSRWYHACTGWTITSERLLTYKYTDPFQKQIPGVIITSRGSSRQFDWRDLTGKKIGFLAGWFTNPACLSRQDGIEGRSLNVDQIKIYPTNGALESALISGEIDATFIDPGVEFVPQHRIRSDELQCSVEGRGMMMRKDTPLEKWWNPAWKALLATNEYYDICDDIERVHGHKTGLRKDLICRRT